MTTNRDREPLAFRFRTTQGTLLADEIAAIEAAATERLCAGVSFHSVQVGALALLKLAVTDLGGGEVAGLGSARIPACVPPPEPPRCAPQEGSP